MTIVEMRVHMDCPGCESKIKKALSKLEGVDNIEIDMAMQKVTVMGWAKQEKVLKTVRRTGRNVELWPYPYNPEYHGYAERYYPAPAHYFNSLPGNGGQYSEPISRYNYRIHGYSGHEHGYHQKPPSSVLVDDRAGSMFSDDNVNACSVM